MKNGILFLGLLSFIGVFCYGPTKNRLVGALNPAVAPGGNFDLSIWSLRVAYGARNICDDGPLRPGLWSGRLYGFQLFLYGQNRRGHDLHGSRAGQHHFRLHALQNGASRNDAGRLGRGLVMGQTNIMTITGEVVQLGGGPGGHVTLGQVFNSTDGIPLCEFEYYADVNGFKILYEEAKGAGSSIDLNTPCALNAKYAFSLSL